MYRAFAVVFALLTVYSTVAISGEPLPSELHGYWVPSKALCSSSLGVHVSPYAIQFRKGKRVLSFPVEACFSCEGGVRYSGIVVWAIPVKAGNHPFTAYFNAGERKGVSVVEISFSGLQAQFPLNNVELKHCGPNASAVHGALRDEAAQRP